MESLLPAEVLRLPDELARVDALLDDPALPMKVGGTGDGSRRRHGYAHRAGD